MTSKFPLEYDNFIIKTDRIIDTVDGMEVVIQEGDDILASHINDIQDTMLSIENTIGLNPAGKFNSVAERLVDLSSGHVLAVPSVMIYSGNAKNINGYNSSVLAAEFLKNFNIAIIGIESIDNATASMTTAHYIASSTSSYTDIYIRIDCSEVGLTQQDILNKIYLIDSIPVKGVFLDNFGYSSLITREIQNTIISSIHSNGLNAIVSCANPDDVFSSGYVAISNQNYTTAIMSSKDYFLLKDFVRSPLSYTSLETMNLTMNKLLSYKNTFKNRILASSYISILEAEQQNEFFLASSTSMLYAIDGVYAGTEHDNPSKKKYSGMPLVGNYKSDEIIVTSNPGKTEYSRITDAGLIRIFSVNGIYKYDFPDIKIPGMFVDAYGLNLKFSDLDFTGLSITTDALTSGTLNKDRYSGSVISAINSAPADQLIPMDRMDQADNSYILNTLKAALPVFDYTKTNNTDGLFMSSKLNALSINSVDGIVISGQNKGLSITGNGFVSAETGVFDVLRANVSLYAKTIKAGKFLGSPTFTPSGNIQMLSNMFKVASSDGLNKIHIKIFSDEHTIPQEYTPAQLNAMDSLDDYASLGVPYETGIQLFEAEYTDDATSTKINAGYLSGSIVSYATTIRATEDVTLVLTIYKADVQSLATVYFDGIKISTITTDLLFKQISFTVKNQDIKPDGQELLIITESHNNVDPSIRFSPNLLDVGNDPEDLTNYTMNSKIARVDCFANKTTKIVGDLIETGTIKAKNIEVGTITAESAIIAEAAIKTANIQEAAIKSAQIDNAAITDAKIDRASVNKLTVVSADIQDAAISNAKIDRASVNKLQVVSADITDAAITNAKIDRLSVDKLQVLSADITDAAITNAKIDRASVNKLEVISADIKDAAIGNAKIDRASVDKLIVISADIKDANITDAKIDRASVDKLVVVSADIKDAAISTAKIEDAAIKSAKIDNAAITDAKIDRASVNKLVVVTADIQDAAIKSAQIDNAAITNAKIAHATIESAKIAYLEGDKIVANSITTGKFSAEIQSTLSDVGTIKTELGVQLGLINLKASQEYVDATIMYKVEIVSTNGSMFRRGTTNTILIAKVYKGSVDVTDILSPSQFMWHRKSALTNEDTIWDNNHCSMKLVAITSEDIWSRAVFSCDILE